MQNIHIKTIARSLMLLLLCFAGTATLRAQQYSISGTPNDGNMGVVYGSGTYNAGDTVVLEAMSMQGCRFTHWSDNSTVKRRVFVASESLSLTAYFETCNYTRTGIDTVVACDSARWIDGYMYYNSTQNPATAPTVTLPNWEGCDSIVRLMLFLSPSPAMTTSNDTAILSGNSVTLSARGPQFYMWEAEGNELSARSETNTITVSPTHTTCYHVYGSMPINNLVANSGFDNGNTGFTSGYTYAAPSGSQTLWNEGRYSIGTTGQSLHANFSPHGDHTSGSGNMMVVNGHGSPNTVVWQQTVNVQPHADYAFSVWVCNQSVCSQNELSVLQFRINDSLLGSPFTAPNDTSTWEQFYEIWNSGGCGTATITIVNQTTVLSGNDFAIDDIGMCRLDGCPAHDSIFVSVGSIADSTICPEQLPFTWNNTIFNGAGTQMAHITTFFGRDSIVTMRVTVRQTQHTTRQYQSCEPLLWQDSLLTTTGSYDFVSTDRFGCDSISTLNLSVFNSNIYDEYKTLCESDLPFTYNDRTYPYGTPSRTDTIHYYDSHSCDSVIHLHLDVHYNPVTRAELLGYDCDLHTFSLTSEHSDEVANVVWSATPADPSLTGQEQNATIHVMPISPTVYTASATIAGTPCSNSINVEVNTAVQVEAAFSITPDTATLSYPRVELQDESLGNINSWEWTLDGEVIGNSPWLTFNYPAPQDSALIRLIVAEARYNCRDTAYGTAYYQKGGTFWAPNAFTPGRDINSTFEIKASYISDFEIFIYARNGQLVFHSTDVEQPWDGTNLQGFACPMGSYTYVVSYIFRESPHNPITEKGNVLLIR